MAAAAIFVAPASYEPFVLSILEATLSICALILGDISSLRENWNGAASFVPLDDPAELIDVIENLISNRAVERNWVAKREPELWSFLARACLMAICRFTRGYWIRHS